MTSTNQYERCDITARHGVNTLLCHLPAAHVGLHFDNRDGLEWEMQMQPKVRYAPDRQLDVVLPPGRDTTGSQS